MSLPRLAKFLALAARHPDWATGGRSVLAPTTVLDARSFNRKFPLLDTPSFILLNTSRTSLLRYVSEGPLPSNFLPTGGSEGDLFACFCFRSYLISITTGSLTLVARLLDYLYSFPSVCGDFVSWTLSLETIFGFRSSLFPSYRLPSPICSTCDPFSLFVAV
jgi:hypothetical protein